MKILEEISNALQKGNAKLVREKVQEAINSNVNPTEILQDSMIVAMSIVGEKFKKNDIFVPEVLIAARAMNEGVKVLRPVLIASGVKPIGKAMICTVMGDLHDIGKNLVKMMIEGQGIECIDIGVDCSPETIIDAINTHQPDVLCLSALLSTTMMNQKVIISRLKEEKLLKDIKVIVGGAPVTETFASEIGADGYASDAASAAILTKNMILQKANGESQC
ncbi:corrinoid protein [Candidatus Izemoplasma sp. B36]|uniref:corrinoid protein n=1 Tax=Candidatus Izemoplasma sp. B36 TaxID=3242468 RepID=UPI003558BBB9